jgi:phosphate/sulfate permease
MARVLEDEGFWVAIGGVVVSGLATAAAFGVSITEVQVGAVVGVVAAVGALAKIVGRHV